MLSKNPIAILFTSREIGLKILDTPIFPLHFGAYISIFTALKKIVYICWLKYHCEPNL